MVLRLLYPITPCTHCCLHKVSAVRYNQKDVYDDDDDDAHDAEARMSTWLLVGLGNPGAQYVNTRHNIGFEVLDAFAAKHALQSAGTRAQAKLSSGTIAGHKVICAWPQTYMNRSGIAVSGLVNWYKVPLNQVVIVYDDLDLPFASLRLREKGSAGTHNGMRSIVQLLGSSEFARLRVGIGKVPAGWDAYGYVLGKFAGDEATTIPQLNHTASDALTHIIEHGMISAMNRYN
ncbi:MAG: hypothetical protein RL076_1954 [Chloroflexota bacterium]